MPAITLKNLPDHLHTELKQRARHQHRSLNGEVIAMLQEAVVQGRSNSSQPATQPPFYRAPISHYLRFMAAFPFQANLI